MSNNFAIPYPVPYAPRDDVHLVGQTLAGMPVYQFRMPVYRSDMGRHTHVVGMDPVTYWVLLATIVVGGFAIYSWRRMSAKQQDAFLSNK